MIENWTEALDKADEVNGVLRAAMTAGPNTAEWTALEAYFADKPDMLSDLPSCREQIMNNGSWQGSGLGALIVTFVKP